MDFKLQSSYSILPLLISCIPVPDVSSGVLITIILVPSDSSSKAKNNQENKMSYKKSYLPSAKNTIESRDIYQLKSKTIDIVNIYHLLRDVFEVINIHKLSDPRLLYWTVRSVVPINKRPELFQD